VKKALGYILDEGKTDGKLLVASYGCSPDTADMEFEFTLSQARLQGNNLAHHLIQSFAPGEAAPEQAHEIGRRLADGILQGKYEYVLTTHIDKGHIHNHVIFCAADMVDHRKYISNRHSLNGLRRTSDRLCREAGLSVIVPGKSGEKGAVEYSGKDGARRTRPATSRKSRAEYHADAKPVSHRSRLRADIDDAIPKAESFDGLLAMLEAGGYEVKRGKHISFRAPGQERFMRMKSLGDGHAEEKIRERIADGNRPQGRAEKIPGRGEPRPAKKTVKDFRLQDPDAVSLVIDIENSVKAQESRGYATWAKRFNLKQKAATLNCLAKNGLNTYDDLNNEFTECAAAVEKARAAVKDAEREMSEVAVLMKHVRVMDKTRRVYSEYRSMKAGNAKVRFRRAHESEIVLHEAAARAVKSSGCTKPPSAAALKKRYGKLDTRKGRLYAEYGRAKRKLKEVSVIKRNVQAALKPRSGKTLAASPER
jgi:hypothetical protein